MIYFFLSKLVVGIKIGEQTKRQLDPLPISTVLAFKKDTAHFSSFRHFTDSVKVTLFLVGKLGTREQIGSLETSVAALVDVGDKVVLPINSPSLSDVGRICLMAHIRCGSLNCCFSSQLIQFF